MIKNVFLLVILMMLLGGCKVHQVAFDLNKMRYYDKNNYSVFINKISCKVNDLSFLDKSIIHKSVVDKEHKTLQIKTFDNVKIIKGNEIADKLYYKFDMVIINGLPHSPQKFIDSYFVKNSLKNFKRLSKDSIQILCRPFYNDILVIEYDY